MNVAEIYPNLIVEKKIEDDAITFRVCFDNGKPGAMVIRIDTIDPYEDSGEFMPYPPGDIWVRFEASEKGFLVADLGGVEGILQPLLWLVDGIKQELDEAESE